MTDFDDSINYEDTDMDRRDSTLYERHSSAIAAALVLAAILWVGSTMTKQGRDLVKVAGNIELVASELKYVREMLGVSRDETHKAILRSASDRERYDMLVSTLSTRVYRLERGSNAP